MERRVRTVPKPRLFALFIVLAFAAPLCTAAATVPNGMQLVAETEYLSLYVNEATTEIAVLDKRSDVLWHSNPPDRDLRSGAASETLRIAYATPNTDRVEMDSDRKSVV